MTNAILNFGSLNIDHVYSVNHIAAPGETIASTHLSTFAGGKGLNQSIALARAGAPVFHAGIVGSDGAILFELLRDNGVNTDHIIQQNDKPSGHAIIQVDQKGENSIVLYQGTNHSFTAEFIDSVFINSNDTNPVLLQNEVNLIDYIIMRAKERGHIIAFNPSPFSSELLKIDFNDVDILLLNEIEGEQLSGERDPDKILSVLNTKYPDITVVLTLGEKGSVLLMGGKTYSHGIYEVAVEDTTAAGDTFTGYFLAGYLADMKPEEILRYAAVASGLAVSAKGAATSIPFEETVRKIITTIDS